jgi:GDP-mannose 6-dehydrogenase
VSAACLADLGHTVVGVDRDELKVNGVQRGQAPFFEPGLQDLVARNVSAGRLVATTSLADALAGSDIALVCVGTPSDHNGNLALDQLTRVCSDICSLLATRTTPLVVAVRSTVFPGTCEEVVREALGPSAHVRVVANPEFLREGSAVRDFQEPALIVVGGDDADAVRRVAGLYAPLGVEPCLVSIRTAELIKYACNAFHALKVSFANEIGALAARLDISGREVMQTFCRDRQLNISPAYLKPGFAFGGSCLPKDLRALNYRATRLDLDLPLLESILLSNRRHLERVIRAVLELPEAPTGIYGLAFKENTDDLRESPVIALVESLIGKGRNLRIYDPQIRLESIHGANRSFVLGAIPHIGRLLVPTAEELLGWSQYLIVAQPPPADLAARLRSFPGRVLDLVGAL